MQHIFIRLFLLLFWSLPFWGCSGSQEPTKKPYNFDKWNNAELVWFDEFEGIEVDTSKWHFQTGAHGWGNMEWQNYTPFEGGNAIVEDGNLKIIAKLIGEGQKVGDYTSARLNSKKSFVYGRIEIRAKIPDYKGPGIWPALWTLGDNIREIGWPASGEIDIMEYVSWRPDSVLATIHSEANNHMNGTQIGTGFIPLTSIEEEFHNFGILWEEDIMQFYIDEIDNIILSIPRPKKPNQSNWPFSNPHFILMNIAIGGNLGGVKGVDDSIFPATMEIDYVKVWQLKEK